MFSLDHVVHFIKEPNKLLQNSILRNLNIVEGGRHVGRPTSNKILHFGNSYIEFLTIDDYIKIENMNHGKNSMVQNIIDSNYEEGFVRFILQVKNIDQLKKKLSSINIETVGPVELSRLDHQGKQIKWRLLFPSKKTNSVQLPYFIEWDEKPDKRSKRLIAEGIISNPKERVSVINIFSKDARLLSYNWKSIFEVPIYEKNNCYKLTFNDFSIVIHSEDSPIVKNNLIQKEGIFQVNISAVNLKKFATTFKGAIYKNDIQIEGEELI